MAGGTGITSLPSRMVGDTPISTNPSACADLSMPPSVRLTEPAELRSSLLMAASCALAVSRMLPYWSRICSILLATEWKVKTPSAILPSEGKHGWSSSALRTASTHEWRVSMVRRRGGISLSSKRVPSTLILCMQGRMSWKSCKGGCGSDRMRAISSTCLCSSLTSAALHRKRIPRTLSSPSVLRQSDSKRWRTSSKPILCSKLSG